MPVEFIDNYFLPSDPTRDVKYARGQNLVTLTKYWGYNPEENLNGNTVYTPGVH